MADLFDLQKIIDLIAGNIYWSDRQGVYRGCNRTTLAVLKLKSFDEFIGKRIIDMNVDREFARETWEMDDAIMASGEPSTWEQFFPDTENGPQVYLTKKVPIKNEHSEVIGLVGVSLNITEQKRVEAELQVAKEEAEKANRAKTEFVLNLSHDLRTPLIGMMGMAEILCDSEVDPAKQKALQDIATASQQLEKFISGILDEVTNPQEVLRHELVDLRELLRNVGSLVTPKMSQKRLLFVLDYPSHLPINIYSDASALKKVFLNLLSNAVKFTEQGSITVKVVKEIMLGKEFLLVQVIDTGIGIPDDKQSLIFEKFMRISQPGAPKNKGYGLGLWASKKLVEQLGGMISLISTLGKGSSFNVYLPLS
jgi:signal transduction histidine kinase